MPLKLLAQYWYLAAIAAIAGLLALLGVQTVRLSSEEAGRANDKALYAEERTKAASAHAEALQANIEEGERRVEAIESVVEEQARRTKLAEEDAARASVAVGGLRQRAAALAAKARSCTADSAAASGRAADQLADASERLAEAGRQFAAIGNDAIIRGDTCAAAYDALRAKPAPRPPSQTH